MESAKVPSLFVSLCDPCTSAHKVSRLLLIATLSPTHDPSIISLISDLPTISRQHVRFLPRKDVSMHVYLTTTTT